MVVDEPGVPSVGVVEVSGGSVVVDMPVAFPLRLGEPQTIEPWPCGVMQEGFMFKVSRSRLFGCLMLALALCAVAFVPVASAADIKVTPKKYYLALGDSLAFGFQSVKVVPPFAESQFTTGYVDALTTQLKTIKPDIQTINNGCPGATTATLNSVAGCTTYPFPLHHSYAPGTSQLGDAVAFLQANPGKVSPITVNIGNNDVLGAVAGCGGLTSPTLIPCLFGAAPALFGTIGANVTSTLTQLRAAAPTAKIILLGTYNPYAAIGFTAGNTLSASLNSVLASVAGGTGADYADPFPAFNGASPQPQTICSLTLMCPGGIPSLSGDIHASDAGYQKLADLIWDASGYANVG